MEAIRKIVRSVLISEGIINEAEKKMILYHGSPYTFENFKDTTTFFSETEDFAVDYADQKSFDYALDAEPKIYKVEVLTDLFDINDPADYKLLADNLPDTVEYAYNNFGFTTEVSKENMLQYLMGKDKTVPYEPAIKAKVGDRIPNPEYAPEEYIVVKKDDMYAYGYSVKNYQSLLGMLTTSPLEWRSSYTPEFKELAKAFQAKVKEIYAKDTGKTYVGDTDVKASIIDANGATKGFRYTQLSDEAYAQIKALYDQAVKSVYSMLPNMEYLKKFTIKEEPVELSDTWRFYENKDVGELIRKLGFGGYVAKESNVKTYAIFHPNKDVRILQYEIPQGTEFSSWEDYQNYRAFDKYIAERLPEGYWMKNRWQLHELYKSGMSAEQAWNTINSNKEDYLYQWKK